MVYCDFEDARRYKEAVPRAKAAGVPIGLATVRILKPGEDGFLKPLLAAEPDAVLVRNLAAMLFFRENAPRAERVGDFSLNVANELTADLFMREGCTRLVPSYDLSWDQLAALVRRSDPAWYEPVIHQHMPMFHMEHCVFAAFMSKGRTFLDCGRPCEKHRVHLRDRVGMQHPLRADVGCRNTLYNAVPQTGAQFFTELLEAGLRSFRIELLEEDAVETRGVIEAYQQVLSGAGSGDSLWRSLRASSQLGVTRGTY
jgi:putative protease